MKCVKEVCKECPFKRDSLAGYLGEASFDPMAFLGPHLQGGEPLPCHLSIDWEADLGGMRVYTDKSLCRGYLIFLKNSCTMPRDLEMAELRNTVEKDTENFFQWQPEFVEHHSKKESA